MPRTATRIAVVAFVISVFLPHFAQAQATRTWVSGVGDDANPCSRTAPCKTFAGAVSKTAAAGEIDCLDPGGFGAITITKSITISCGSLNGGILAAGVTAITINAAATDTVVLKGIDIQGAGSGIDGVRIIQASQVVIQDSSITGLTGVGVSSVPNTTGTRLVLKDVTITNSANGGVKLRPASTGFATISMSGVTISKSSFGIQIDSSGGSSSVIADIRDSVISGNTNAGIQTIGSSVAIATVTRTNIFQNATGLLAASGTLLRVGESVITSNGVGVSGTVNSFGTNQLSGNNTDGTLILLPAPALK